MTTNPKMDFSRANYIHVTCKGIANLDLVITTQELVQIHLWVGKPRGTYFT